MYYYILLHHIKAHFLRPDPFSAAVESPFSSPKRSRFEQGIICSLSIDNGRREYGAGVRQRNGDEMGEK